MEELGIDYFRAIQSTLGIETKKDATINDARIRLSRDYEDSIAYKPNALKNGVKTPLLATENEVRYKANIVMFPGDDLCVGDILNFDGENWIVMETAITNPIEITGLAWMCNHKFRFQNFTPKIIERWGVLDSGVYSTTLTGDRSLQTPDKQFKIYLQYDEETKKIYEDKRLAVDTKYDQYGNEILEVYKVTGRNKVARSYGKGGKLLILEVRSDVYSDADNIQELICDYISGDSSESVEPSEFMCSIKGRSSIRYGTNSTYTAEFIPNNEKVEARWNITNLTDGINYITEGNSLTISVPKSDFYINRKFTIELSDSEGRYMSTKLNVEVTS